MVVRNSSRTFAILLLVGAVGVGNLFALHTRAPYRKPATKKVTPAAVRATATRKTAKRARRVRWSPVLKGSHESLVRANVEIDRLELPRIENDEQLLRLEESQDLVPLFDSDAMQVAPNIKPTRRYCRPWTRAFVEDLSSAFYAEFGRPLIVTSAVRTMEQQQKLRRRNRNAAPIQGETASSHMAGTTIDIGKGPMTRAERAWFDQFVLPLANEHIVEAVEERHQACYHIMVAERYGTWRQEHRLETASAGSTE